LDKKLIKLKAPVREVSLSKIKGLHVKKARPGVAVLEKKGRTGRRTNIQVRKKLQP